MSRFFKTDTFYSDYFHLHSTGMKCLKSEDEGWLSKRMEMLQLSVESINEMCYSFIVLVCSTSWITAWLCYQFFISWSGKLLWRWSKRSDLSVCPYRGQSDAIPHLKGQYWCCPQTPHTEHLGALWWVVWPDINISFSKGSHFTVMIWGWLKDVAFKKTHNSEDHLLIFLSLCL